MLSGFLPSNPFNAVIRSQPDLDIFKDSLLKNSSGGVVMLGIAGTHH